MQFIRNWTICKAKKGKKKTFKYCKSIFAYFCLELLHDYQHELASNPTLCYQKILRWNPFQHKVSISSFSGILYSLFHPVSKKWMTGKMLSLDHHSGCSCFRIRARTSVLTIGVRTFYWSSKAILLTSLGLICQLS